MSYRDRDYNAIYNAGQNLVQNRGNSQNQRYNYDPNPNYGYANNSFNQNYPQSSDTSRYDELDILDQFSKPLLQKQGGDLMGNLSSIQLGQERRINQPQIRGSSANVRNQLKYNNGNQYNQQNPFLPPPPPPYYSQNQYPHQYFPPEAYGYRKKDDSYESSRALQKQLDKQNDILSQLVSNLDRNKNAQMNQSSQPQYDYSNKIKEVEKEYQMMNEIQNLRREINAIQSQKTQTNPYLQSQQQMQMMQMQQMMMNPYSNPMMMMLMNQMNQTNMQQPQFPGFQPPFGYPPQQPPQQSPQQINKQNEDNRLEELLKELLKEKALNNAMRNDNYPKRDSTQKTLNRTYNTNPRRSSNLGNDYLRYTDPDQMLIPNQQSQNTLQSDKHTQQKVDTRRAKQILIHFVLFIKWLKEEVIKSKTQFKQYEVDEFKNDYTSSVQAALPWLLSCSNKAFSTIATNCAKEQDIVDDVAKKLSAKDQDLRFTNYTTECDFIIDEITRGVQSIPEAFSLFIVKKFYDNSYFANNPVNFSFFLSIIYSLSNEHPLQQLFYFLKSFLFEFEIDRLEFDPFDARLLNIDNNPDSPRFKMLIMIFVLLKIYFPMILIKPWSNQLDPTIKLKENYITSKTVSIICSIIYYMLMDYLKATVPVVQRNPQQETWKAITHTIIINNSTVQLKSLDTTKNELLTLLISKEQLSVFFSKKQQWVESFKKKLDEMATVFRQKLQPNRITYLELRKELLQEKAKELQKFIPKRLRNVTVEDK